MKIRNGFVSNSSSSSFICEVCGQDASGYDMCLSEAGMYTCKNGHTFCEDHVLEMGSEKEMCIEILKSSIEGRKLMIEKYPNDADYKNYLDEDVALLKEVEESDEDEYDYDEVMEDYEFRYELPAKYCPICQMEHVTNDDMVSYLFKKFDLKSEDVKSEIKSTFKNYDDFKNYKN